MKPIKLDKKSPSVDELLAIARREPVLLVTPDGENFVLEEADDFDREVVELVARPIEVDPLRGNST